eukprot:1429986-Amphidinium_carterae.2
MALVSVCLFCFLGDQFQLLACGNSLSQTHVAVQQSVASGVWEELMQAQVVWIQLTLSCCLSALSEPLTPTPQVSLRH